MTFALTLNSVTCAETDQPFNHNTVTVFTLELSRECLLVLLVLQCHRLRPLELLVHLIRYHPGVHRPADHGDQQETLEDPPLPPGAHPVSHVGPAPLPAVCTRKPRLCCWKLRSQLFFFFFFFHLLVLRSPPAFLSVPQHFQAEKYELCANVSRCRHYFSIATSTRDSPLRLQSSRSDFRLTSRQTAPRRSKRSSIRVRRLLPGSPVLPVHASTFPTKFGDAKRAKSENLKSPTRPP